MFGVSKLAVLVADKRNDPVMRCPNKRARLAVERGRAGLHHRCPVTIGLKARTAGEVEPASGYGRRPALPSAIEIAGLRRGVCV